MVEKLNILLDAAAELGKPDEVLVRDRDFVILGATKDGGRFSLNLSLMEDSNDRS